MATEVINPKEVLLNSVHYPLIGKIRPQLTSVFPEKQVVGDYTLVSDPYVDTWILSDQRGGILIEEMDETKHPDRCYWSTCNLGFKGHIILPPLATAMPTEAVVTAPTIVNADMELETGWTNGTRQAGGRTGYAWKCANGEEAYQDVVEYCPGAEYTFTVWCKRDSVGDKQRIGIHDGINATYSTATEYAAYTEVSIAKTLATTATQCRLLMDADGTDDSYFDDASIAPTTPITGLTTPTAYENFNGNTYVAFGAKLVKVESTAGVTWDFVGTMPATITDIIAGVNDSLYIFMGDAQNYAYCSTTHDFAHTDVADATYGVYWDDKLFKIDSAGQLSYTATPNTGSPSWTANGKLPIADNAIKRLRTFYNVDGDDVIYAGTSNGLWIHDFANAKWLRTQLQTPDHTNSGKGCVHWRDAFYISAGLDVHKYIPEVPATIQSVGLDRDDGLPAEYAGEIVEAIGGYNEFYVLNDASQVTGTGYSTVMAYDGRSWHCKWADTNADKVMVGGIVGTVFEYRLYFDCDNVVYAIPLHRNLRNPLKISTDTHALAGVHITPWFDANWQVGNKLALRFKVNVLGDVSADEDVVVRYRTDHATSAIASANFTALTPTIEASGLTTYNFASSVGSAFKSIQFRFDLARKAADTDETPDIQYAVLEYVKVIPKRWGWRFTVDCSQDWHGRTSKQLIDALITAAELETLVTLVYDTTTLYVQIKSVTGERETGRTRKGQFEVFCTELF